MYDATPNSNKNDISELFEDILDVNKYQATSNNATCSKHIDYTTSKGASHLYMRKGRREYNTCLF